MAEKADPTTLHAIRPSFFTHPLELSPTGATKQVQLTQPGYYVTGKAQAFPIPSGGENLVYSFRWC